MKKKLLALLLGIGLLLAAVPSVAESGNATAGYSGTVTWRNTITLTAPFGGTLLDYALRVGDTVQAGQTLFTLDTDKVYAATSGTVRGLRAQPGDDAATVTDRYGALLYLEPAGRYTLSASTNNAYKSTDNHNVNRYITEGETVYLRSSDDNDRTGVGIVTKVDGRNFEVEVQSGNLDMEDTVSIYRDEAYSTKERLASYAKVQRAKSLAVTAEGSVLRCAVAEGDTVQRGDLLFEMVKGTLPALSGTDAAVVSPVDGVIVSLSKDAGATINQKDVLATLYAANDLMVTFDVDESDLDLIEPGNRVTVTLDALAGRKPMEGTVDAVSGITTSEDGSTQYTAYVTLSDVADLRPGMSVSVYLAQ